MQSTGGGDWILDTNGSTCAVIRLGAGATTLGRKPQGAVIPDPLRPVGFRGIGASYKDDAATTHEDDGQAPP
jgi:hypothetical protein